MRPAAGTTSIDGSALAMRDVRFDEISEVLRLVRRAVEAGCRNHYDPEQRNAVYASYARNLFLEAVGPLRTIVAEVRARVVGVAQVDHADQRLRALFVDAGHQRGGVGRALLAHAEESARQRGATRLHGAMSLNAVSFYLRSGFRPCDGPERLVSTAVAVPVLRMEKDLRRGRTPL